jgi:MFS family permease
MNGDYKKRLEQNLDKLVIYKIFTKRFYLPLIAIHLVNVGGVTLEQLALIAVITTVAQFLLQIPGGYLADKHGNKVAIRTGVLIALFAPLMYVAFPNFWGGLVGSLMFFGGYSLTSGAIEAFVHDTLAALGRERGFSKVMGRAQSIGLLANVFFITLVPLTYTINKNLPFLLGFLGSVALLAVVWSFTYPKREHHQAGFEINPIKAAKKVVTADNLVVFLFAGFAMGVATRAPEYREILFQDVGIAVAWFGAIIALSSLLGALFARYVHLLDDLKPLTFYLFDIVFMSVCLLIIGITSNPYLVAGGFTLFVAYTRVRYIVFFAKLLNGTAHRYKATLLSALNTFTPIGEIAAMTLLVGLVGIDGVGLAYKKFGVLVFGIGITLWLLIFFRHRYSLKNAT